MKKKRTASCIGVDVSGAELSPDAIIHAVFELPQAIFANTSFVLYATHDEVKKQEKHYKDELSHLPVTFRACKEVIGMDEAPLVAIKKKKESTLAIGLKEHASGKTNAFISCANTGALVTASVLTLDTIPEISRPALLTLVPTQGGSGILLDVGASVVSSREQLIQFAYLGASFAKHVMQVKKPKVCLLNIGVEAGKGIEELVKAHEWLQKRGKSLPFTFVGNAEPRDLFFGDLDVVITSGFTGNILLKTAEAVSHFLMDSIEKSFPQGTKPDTIFPFSEIKKTFSQDEGLGALLYGIDGYVIKCHGEASIASLQKAILGAKSLVEKGLLEATKSFLHSAKIYTHTNRKVTQL